MLQRDISRRFIIIIMLQLCNVIALQVKSMSDAGMLQIKAEPGTPMYDEKDDTVDGQTVRVCMTVMCPVTRGCYIVRPCRIQMRCRLL